MPRRKKNKRNKQKSGKNVIKDTPIDEAAEAPDAVDPASSEEMDTKLDETLSEQSQEHTENTATEADQEMDAADLVNDVIKQSEETATTDDAELNFDDIDALVSQNTNKPLGFGSSSKALLQEEDDAAENIEENKAPPEGTTTTSELVPVPDEVPTATQTPPPEMTHSRNGDGVPPPETEQVDEVEEFEEKKESPEPTPTPPPDYSHLTREEKVSRIEEIQLQLREINAELEELRQTNQQLVDWYEAPRLRAEKHHLIQQNIKLLTKCKDNMLLLKKERDKTFQQKTIQVTFRRRPLGIGLRGIPDNDGVGAVLLDVLPKFQEHLMVGMRLIRVLDQDVTKMPYIEVVRLLKHSSLPLSIVFEKQFPVYQSPIPHRDLNGANFGDLPLLTNFREFGNIDLMDLRFATSLVDQQVILVLGVLGLRILNMSHVLYASSRRLCRILLDYGADPHTFEDLLKFKIDDMTGGASLLELQKLEERHEFPPEKWRPVILYLVAKSLSWVRPDHDMQVIESGAKFLEIEEMDLEEPIERLIRQEQQLRELRADACAISDDTVFEFFYHREV